MVQKHKQLYWEGFSKKDFKEFPIDVQKDNVVHRPVEQYAAFSQTLEGVGYELVEDHRNDTFRAVYTVKMGDAVHALHAFQKKSKPGIATPQPDAELIEKRLKAVLARHKSGR